jgi:predicted phage tail protein
VWLYVNAGTSTITATFTPTNTALYASNTKTFNITVTATAPAAPTGLAATAGNTQATLSWTAASNGGSNITDYLIEYSTDNSTWSTFADGTSTATSATVTGLTNGTLYYFRVSAINAVNTSAASSTASTTPVVPLLVAEDQLLLLHQHLPLLQLEQVHQDLLPRQLQLKIK